MMDSLLEKFTDLVGIFISRHAHTQSNQKDKTKLSVFIETDKTRRDYENSR